MSDTIAVPATFYDDHAERDLPTPAAVRRAGRRVWLRADDPELRELLDDARHYVDLFGPGQRHRDDSCPRSVVDSAIRTVAALERQPLPSISNRGIPRA